MIEQLLRRQLKAAGLRNRHLQSEMLDHFMCSYEDYLENGYQSSEALEAVIKEINTNDLGSMNRSYLILNLKSNVHIFSHLLLKNEKLDTCSGHTLWMVAEETPSDKGKIPVRSFLE